MLFVTDIRGGGVLGEDSEVRILMGGGEETAKGGTGGGDIEAAFGARFAELIDGVVVGLPVAEVEDMLLVFPGEGVELASGFTHNGRTVAEGVGQIRSYPKT